ARTEPPAPPPVSDFPSTVAAVGLVEAGTENISVGTPPGGVVVKGFVTAGQAVKAGGPPFQLRLRHLPADVAGREQAAAAARPAPWRGRGRRWRGPTSKTCGGSSSSRSRSRTGARSAPTS